MTDCMIEMGLGVVIFSCYDPLSLLFAYDTAVTSLSILENKVSWHPFLTHFTPLYLCFLESPKQTIYTYARTQARQILLQNQIYLVLDSETTFQVLRAGTSLICLYHLY